MADITVWQIVAIVFFVIFAILLAVTISIFFRLDILAVIGDLSGKTAAKQIQQIKTQGISTTKKVKKTTTNNTHFNSAISQTAYSTEERREQQMAAHPSKNLNVNLSMVQQPIVDTQTHTKSKGVSGTVSLDSINYTDSLNKDSDTDVLGVQNNASNESTEVLSNDIEGTVILNNETATEFLADTEETEVLNSEQPTDVLSVDDDEGGTSVLSDYNFESTTVLSQDQSNQGMKIEILDEETFINTDEVIN